MTWRDKFRPVIANVLSSLSVEIRWGRGSEADKAIQAALRTAWGSMSLESYERKGYPYGVGATRSRSKQASASPRTGRAGGSRAAR